LSPVAREILAYLRRCPRANDTVEGINEWWLLEQRIRSSVVETQAALEQLIERRLVVGRRGRDGRLRYSEQVRRQRVERGATKRVVEKPAKSGATKKRGAQVGGKI
jgi:hypothetical protein